jgi:transposase
VRKCETSDIALIVDNAGWHSSKDLNIPKNITLVPFPPYAPELNAMEQVWEWRKSYFLSNQYYPLIMMRLSRN